MFPRRGRPRRVEKVKLVKFRESTFQLCNERKKALGHNRLTNSEFAEILLHRGDHEPVKNLCRKDVGLNLNGLNVNVISYL